MHALGPAHSWQLLPCALAARGAGLCQHYLQKCLHLTVACMHDEHSVSSNGQTGCHQSLSALNVAQHRDCTG